MPPFTIHQTSRLSRWLITCDHATNRVPETINNGNLGLPAADMARHIAYDVGARGLAIALADRLGAPALLSDFSRLVIDPNRGEDDPTVLMKLYDGSIIPANRSAGPTERERRLAAFHRPYHRAQADMAARRADTVIVSVHSFTPQLRGRPPRPWHVGILSGHDRRLADPLLTRLRALGGVVVGDNQPYNGHLPGDSIDRHALKTGRLNVLIEVRNDLIADPRDQLDWADRLAPELTDALKQTTL